MLLTYLIQNGKKKALTIRLDTDLLKTLEHECAKRNVSMNTFLNQIFRNYKEWFSIAGMAGFVPLSREILTSLFENTDEEQLLAISNEVGQGKKSEEQVVFLKDKFDAVAYLEFLELWLEAGGFPFKHEIMEEDDGSLHTVCMQFNMGRKWSFFSASLIDNMFKRTGVKHLEFQITDDQVTFKVKP